MCCLPDVLQYWPGAPEFFGQIQLSALGCRHGSRRSIPFLSSVVGVGDTLAMAPLTARWNSCCSQPSLRSGVTSSMNCLCSSPECRHDALVALFAETHQRHDGLEHGVVAGLDGQSVLILAECLGGGLARFTFG